MSAQAGSTLRARAARGLERIWYARHPLRWALVPLSGLFCAVAVVRRWRHRAGRGQGQQTPVLVVGNVTVGGTGKTPLVIALAEALQEAGWTPGVVSRGYGGRRREDPLLVGPETPAVQAGDEPVLIAQRTGCPVVVGRDRRRALERLLAVCPGCDVVLSDDGLQHYRLHRDLEIAVVDARRGLGNRWCLPAGPLREPAGRLRSVEWVVLRGEGEPPGVPCDARMRLRPGTPYNLCDPALRRPLAAFRRVPVAAVAGIGEPAQFFAMLRAQGLDVEARAFEDHHRFTSADLDFAQRSVVLMTEKDAVKIRAFARPTHWVVPVEARVDGAFLAAVVDALRRRSRQVEETADG